MKLLNHIANRFLNDETILWEIMELMHPTIFKIPNDKPLTDEMIPEGAMETWMLLSNKDNKSYYITDSVTDNLELLKVKRKDDKYDYTIFKHLKPQKCTFILPDNKLVRMWIPEGEKNNDQMVFQYLKFEFRDKGDKLNGWMNNCIFFCDKNTGEQCSHFEHRDVKEIEDYLYKLLCFIYLSETEELLLKPGQKSGTKKSGKIINDIKHPLIIVTSKWNITSVRTEGFTVSGHFRLQPIKDGSKVIFIEPFEKSGYVRTAKKELSNV